MKVIPDDVIIDIGCKICFSNEKDVDILNNCGNTKCSYLMCNECIRKLKKLPESERNKCPHCRNILSDNLLKIQNENINNKKKILVKTKSRKCYFADFCHLSKITFNKVAVYVFFSSLIFYLGNELIYYLKFNFLSGINSFLEYIIYGFLGGVTIVLSIFVFIIIFKKLFFCLLKNKN